MVEISGLTLDTTVNEIVEKLRIDTGYFRDIKDCGDNLIVTCPYHKGGMERKPSFGISKRNGVCHCFTCGVAETMPDLISHCFGVYDVKSFIFGTNWLKENFDSISIENRKPLDIDVSRSELPHKLTTYVPDMVLNQYRYTHPYLHKRKITDDVINIFDIGYDKETDCITMPVRDLTGSCLFVARRSVKSKWFNYPSGAEKPLYGLWEAIKYYPSAREIVVCESMFNCWTCWTHGIPAIALNGTGSYEQLDSLTRIPYRALILCLDPDDAGIKGTNKIVSKVKNKLLYTVDYKDNRDLNDLSFDEFEQLFCTKHLI